MNPKQEIRALKKFVAALREMEPSARTAAVRWLSEKVAAWQKESTEPQTAKESK